jgi:hypothetical protein
MDLVVQRLLHRLWESQHLVIGESNDFDAHLVELCRSVTVVARLPGFEVLPAVEFHESRLKGMF